MKHHNIKTLLAFFMAVAIFTSSCQKDNGTDGLTDGQATVTINMKGIGASIGNNSPGLRSSTGKSTAAPAVQRQVVKFNEQYNVTATLREVTPAAPALRSSANRAETTATGTGAILPLAAGTDYTIIVYKDGTAVHTQTFTQGEDDYTFELAAGNYTFVAHAYGDASADESSADRDPLWWTAEQTITSGANTLEIVLAHKLTEVTVVFNAGAGRTINAIGAGTLDPNHTFTFDEETGVVTFAGATTAAAVSFAGQSAGQIWTSVPTMIAVENTANGVVDLPNVTINDIAGSITSDGWALRAGVQYRLELNLGDKEEEGFEIGDETWSPGNLTYDPSTGEYGFVSDTQGYGNYWFPGYLLPKQLDGTNQNPSTGHNGGAGDPCASVATAGTWRLPTEAEIDDLIASTAAGQETNTPVTWYPMRYSTHYNGTLGMFLGTQVAPENSEDFAFFPFAGYYPNDNNGEPVGREGAYLASTTTGYTVLHLTMNTLNSAEGATAAKASWVTTDSNTAVQIRCVKN